MQNARTDFQKQLKRFNDRLDIAEERNKKP